MVAISDELALVGNHHNVNHSESHVSKVHNELGSGLAHSKILIIRKIRLFDVLLAKSKSHIIGLDNEVGVLVTGIHDTKKDSPIGARLSNSSGDHKNKHHIHSAIANGIIKEI